MRLTTAFFITFFSSIIVVLSGLVNNIIIVRMLGPEGQGVYTLIVTTSVMFLVFGSAGLVMSNTYWTRKNRNEASAIFTNSLIFSGLMALIAAAAYLSFGRNFMLRFFTPDISLILVLALPLLLIQEFNQGILWGMERYDYHNFLNIFKAVSIVIATLIFVFVFKLGVRFAILGWLVAVFLTSVASVFVITREVGMARVFPDFTLLFRSLRTGLKVLASDILWFLSTRVDLYLVAYFSGAGQTGFYSIAILFMQMAGIIPSIIGKLIFNTSITVAKAGNLTSINLIKSIFLYSFAASIIIIFFGKIAINVFFGKDFARSFECLLFLLPATIAQNINIGIGQFINGKKAIPVYNVLAIFMTLAVNILLNLRLIPGYGIIGAAISSSVSQIVHLCLLLIIMKKLGLFAKT